MKLLLEREDVNPDRLDNSGRKKPLPQADRNGGDGVARLLLEREDVNPYKPNNYGQIQLSWAVRDGHGEVVKLLRARGAAIPGGVWCGPWRYDGPLSASSGLAICPFTTLKNKKNFPAVTYYPLLGFSFGPLGR